MVYFFVMTNFFAWVKKNLVLITIIVVLAIALLMQYKRSQPMYYGDTGVMSEPAIGMGGRAESLMLTKSSDSMGMESMPYDPVAPAPDVANRMVVTNSYLGLVVDNVVESVESIRNQVQTLGGYVVNSSITRPEDGGTATITIRIPSEKLGETLSALKGQAVEVVSENLDGYDVTDQFVDNAARLTILEQNKARFEEIMAAARTVDEIVKVQQQIFSLQSQIDSIKGQQKYLEETAKSSLVVVYLSTDELSLPYTPDDAWRPEVIFKTAVRGLLTTAQSLGSMLIWVVVYSIIWLPILVIIILVSKRLNKNPPTTN